MTSYPFLKIAACSHIGSHLVNIDQPRSAIVGLSVVLKFGVDRIRSF